MRGWRALLALLVVGATALVLPAPQSSTGSVALAAPAPVGNPSDFAYKWDPATWGASASYLEWWYIKVSEFGDRPDDPTPGVQENYFFVIEVVNPWDTHEPPKEPTSGVYVYFGSMVGENRLLLMQKLPLSAFSSGSSTHAEIHVCADERCSSGAYLANDPSDPDKLTLRMTFDTRDRDLVVVDRVGDRDPEESALAPPSSGPSAVTDFARLSIQLNIKRTVGFHPGAVDQVPKDSTNPLLNWLVFAVDGEVQPGALGAPAISWVRDDGSAQSTALPSNAFRAYADTNWGTALPEAWIWGQAAWPGTDTAFTMGGGCPRGVAQCHDGLLPADTWTGTFFLQFLNQRADPPGVENYSHSSASALDGWRVTAQVSTALRAYADREGWWEIPLDWSVTFEDMRGCAVDPAANDRRKATVEISATADRIFDLNISSPWMKFLGGTPGAGINGASDPFHDFEALDATAKLWMWYCDGRSGSWVPEVAPDGSHNWPIVAPIGAYEFGLFQGRIDAAEVFASPARASLDGQVATVEFYGKNIGGRAAEGVAVSLAAREYDPSRGIFASRPICTSATREGLRGEWLAPGERQDGSDTLSQTCSFDAGSGNALVVGPVTQATARPAGLIDGQPGATWTSTLDIHSCEIFEVVVTTASRQVDYDNDVRSTTWCPFGGPSAVQLSLGVGASATFADGSRTQVVSADGTGPIAVAFAAGVPSGTTLDIPLTVTRLDTGYATTVIVRVQGESAPAALPLDAWIAPADLFAADTARGLRP